MQPSEAPTNMGEPVNYPTLPYIPPTDPLKVQPLVLPTQLGPQPPYAQASIERSIAMEHHKYNEGNNL